MTKTITANIPARKIGGHPYPARAATYMQDDAGTWRNQYGEKVHELDVIDVCKAATNWTAIHAEHFPMFGFSA